MDETEILSRIRSLVGQEHELRARVATGEITTEEEPAALRRAEDELDQCWDLLRQRRAHRDFGQNPDATQSRPVGTVEGYQQ